MAKRNVLGEKKRVKSQLTQEAADYLAPKSWVILEDAKTIVENAIENPTNKNIESILHRLLDKGASKTQVEINAILTANKTLSDETKDGIRKEFQTYLNDVLKWMIGVYDTKTSLEPLYLNLGRQQQTLFDRISNLTGKTEQNGGNNRKIKYTIEVRKQILKLKTEGEQWKEIVKQLNQLYPKKKYTVNATKKWYSEQMI
ncbi:MAG: hypothetical protein WC412_06575 [Candidatus Omnitrophota bacterium]|jgi:hypothetical protein